MRAERDPVTGTQTGAAALGVEERSGETPRAEVEQDRSAPDPEVVAKPTRRHFTAEYRPRILEETDRCALPGEVGRLLRREGLYTSHLAARRKARRSGSLRGLVPKKRGAKPAEHNSLNAKVCTSGLRRCHWRADRGVGERYPGRRGRARSRARKSDSSLHR